MAQVFDDQGTAYDAVQVTVPTVVNGFTTPVGWWIVTDPLGRRSPVSPASFLSMFSPAQGVLNLGTPGAAASLDQQSHVIQHSSWEGVPYGVATLDANSRLVQTGGLALLDASGHVIQDPASKGLPNGVAPLDANGNFDTPLAYANMANGVATLDANGDLHSPLAYAGQANGVATLNASAKVVQDPASKGVANGVAGLDNNGHVLQNSAWLGLNNGMLALDSTGHIKAPFNSTKPTPATVANGGYCVIVAGWDQWGVIAVKVGSIAPGVGSLVCTVSFASTWDAAPIAGFVLPNSSAGFPFYLSGFSTTLFGIYASQANIPNSEYDAYYLIV